MSPISPIIAAIILGPSLVTADMTRPVITAWPTVNPITSPYFSVAAAGIPPDVSFGANIIYVRTTGSDANDGLTTGTAKLTPVGGMAAVGTTGNWKLDIGAGTFAGADATRGHVFTKLSTGQVYVVGAGLTTILSAGGAATSTLCFTTSPATNIIFSNIKIGDGVNGLSAGVVKLEVSTNVNRIAFDNVTIDPGPTAGRGIFINAVVAGSWRSSTYVGDIAFRNVIIPGNATGSVWSQGTGTGVPKGLLFANCTAAGINCWSPNRMYWNDVWLENPAFSATSSDASGSSNYGFLWGSDTSGATTPAENVIATNLYINGGAITSSSGHAILIGDNCSNVLVNGGNHGCGGGTATANIQGIVCKNASRCRIQFSTIVGDCSASGVNNTAGIYHKGGSFFSVFGCSITVNNNGIGLQTNLDSKRPSQFVEVRGNSITASGAAAKCVLFAAGSTPPLIVDGNTYRYIAGAALTGTNGVRGLTCANLAAMQTQWQKSNESIERLNDLTSREVLV